MGKVIQKYNLNFAIKYSQNLAYPCKLIISLKNSYRKFTFINKFKIKKDISKYLILWNILFKFKILHDLIFLGILAKLAFPFLIQIVQSKMMR